MFQNSKTITLTVAKNKGSHLQFGEHTTHSYTYTYNTCQGFQYHRKGERKYCHVKKKVVWCFVVGSCQLPRASYWPWPAVINRPCWSARSHTHQTRLIWKRSTTIYICREVFRKLVAFWNNCVESSQVEIQVPAQSGRGNKLVRD